MLRLSVALVAVVFWYIAPRCGKLPEWQGIPIPCPIKNTSIRRPQWYRNAVLSPCSIRIGGIRATAGAHGR